MRKSPKFSPEVRERAVRMVQEHRHEHPVAGLPSNPSPAKIGCVPQTLHAWVRQHEIDDGQREGVSTLEVQRIKELSERGARTAQGQRDPAKLASAFFAPGGARPPHQVLKASVDQHRQQFGVESICRAMQIAPSAYWRHAARWHNPALCSRRAQRDASLVPLVQRVASQLPGLRADKVWRQLNREGVAVASLHR